MPCLDHLPHRTIPSFTAHQLYSEEQFAHQQAQAMAEESERRTNALPSSGVVPTSHCPRWTMLRRTPVAQEEQRVLLMKMISSLLTFHMYLIQVCLQWDHEYLARGYKYSCAQTLNFFHCTIFSLHSVGLYVYLMTPRHS